MTRCRLLPNGESQWQCASLVRNDIDRYWLETIETGCGYGHIYLSRMTLRRQVVLDRSQHTSAARHYLFEDDETIAGVDNMEPERIVGCSVADHPFLYVEVGYGCILRLIGSRLR